MNALCIHGHFYQPPREDPLSGIIPDEKGAEPFRNWNERILAECYLPNAKLGNFEKISFNIGPTLLHWMEKYDPATYHAIIQQERNIYEKFGVGNGMAQAYNHVILPLASKRDKITQIKWGIADFKSRFGHEPLGMWLPETAVDLETLAFLSDNHIQFTILAPWQVETDDNFSPEEPYLVELPGNRDPMVVFFYNQGLSTLVSFDDEATINADAFIENHLKYAFHKTGDAIQDDHLQLIASDGELYGHHKAFRQKFLAYLMNGALNLYQLETTFPAVWLQNHYPSKWIKISEYTSWSCHHGIVRWMGECDCTPGASWKAPLRWGLEKLAVELDHQYQIFMGQFTRRKWQLRNDYIHVFLGECSLKTLLSKYINQTLTDHEMDRIRMMLAAQYERQRIFTSCGWFFESFHRIEPQNNIAYAAQAVWLTHQVTGKNLAPKALALLKKVKDPRTGLRGDTVFAERLRRTEDYAEDKSFYFNASKS